MYRRTGFRYPPVRRRPNESPSDYYARRSEVRSKARTAYLERLRNGQNSPEHTQVRTNWRLAFDTYGEFVGRSERPESATFGRSSRSRDDWAGTANFEQAIQLARFGWPDGAEQLAAITARLEGKLANASESKRMAFDVMGPGTLDVGRWLIGHPEQMMVWRPSEELTDLNPNRVLRLLVNGSMHAGTPHDQIFWRGAAAFAVCDMAESQGVRCEIELAFNVSAIGYPSQSRSTQTIMLKRAQDAIDPDQLAFTLCHPASFRRIAFGVQETLETAERRAMGFGENGMGGYGHPQDLPAEEIGDAIYFPANCYAFNSAEATAKWVVAKLAEHEIEVSTT
jgi:hypothetical protein